MTVVVKLLLELSSDTRWLGVLLGPRMRSRMHRTTEPPAADAGPKTRDRTLRRDLPVRVRPSR